MTLMGGQTSAVVHDSDMSFVCDVDMTVSIVARAYDDSINQQ